jgi:DNA-binding XRE family transcriptional regulator
VTKNFESAAHIELLNHLKEVRAEAIEHARIARNLARERRRIMDQLIAEGFNQTDLARELGLTRQAIQKMIAAGQE